MMSPKSEGLRPDKQMNNFFLDIGDRISSYSLTQGKLKFVTGSSYSVYNRRM